MDPRFLSASLPEAVISSGIDVSMSFCILWCSLERRGGRAAHPRRMFSNRCADSRIGRIDRSFVRRLEQQQENGVTTHAFAHRPVILSSVFPFPAKSLPPFAVPGHILIGPTPSPALIPTHGVPAPSGETLTRSSIRVIRRSRRFRRFGRPRERCGEQGGCGRCRHRALSEFGGEQGRKRGISLACLDVFHFTTALA